MRMQPRLDELEKRLIIAALERSRGHRGQAAEALGITRDGLRLKIQRLGIETGNEPGH